MGCCQNKSISLVPSSIVSFPFSPLASSDSLPHGLVYTAVKGRGGANKICRLRYLLTALDKAGGSPMVVYHGFFSVFLRFCKRKLKVLVFLRCLTFRHAGTQIFISNVGFWELLIWLFMLCHILHYHRRLGISFNHVLLWSLDIGSQNEPCSSRLPSHFKYASSDCPWIERD